MKIAPLYRALSSAPWCDARIIHTGQHYDAAMSATFFRDLCLELVTMLEGVSARLPIVFAVHPRTRKRLQEFDLEQRVVTRPGISVTGPLGYIDFMSLVKGCAIAITDSGGVQEETTYLGIPCATLRENTERPITLIEGTNRLLAPSDVARAVDEVLMGHWPQGRRPQYWDGHTAKRAAASLQRFLRSRGSH